MDEAIEKHILSLTDSELVEYVSSPPDTYTPEAVAFAKEEAARRHISPGVRVATLVEMASRTLQQSKIEAEPLGKAGKILVLLFGPLIVVIILGLYFRRKGYHQKANDLWHYWFLGLAFWIVMGLGIGIVGNLLRL